jgi:hypothetical protein
MYTSSAVSCRQEVAVRLEESIVPTRTGTSSRADRGPCVVTVGVCDGVHRGHTELIGRAVEAGRARDQPTVLVTFDPHPARILARELGVDRVVAPRPGWPPPGDQVSVTVTAGDEGDEGAVSGPIRSCAGSPEAPCPWTSSPARATDLRG